MKRPCPSPFISAAVTLFTCLAAAGAASDWPQWRGPLRNGILPDSPPLADQWPAKGLTKLWDSEAIPSDDDGGHGSVVAAGGRVYAAIVWHTDVPTETRGIDDLVMRQLGYQSVAGWPKETVEKMEKDAALARSEADRRGVRQVRRGLAREEPRCQKAADQRGLRARPVRPARRRHPAGGL